MRTIIKKHARAVIVALIIAAAFGAFGAGLWIGTAPVRAMKNYLERSGGQLMVEVNLDGEVEERIVVFGHNGSLVELPRSVRDFGWRGVVMKYRDGTYFITKSNVDEFWIAVDEEQDMTNPTPPQEDRPITSTPRASQDTDHNLAPQAPEEPE